MLKKTDLAKELNISIASIDRLMAKGMPYLKIGKSVRFDLEKVINYLEREVK